MKLTRARRLIVLMALTALPILLAWYMAAKRSWLPQTRTRFGSTISNLSFSQDGSTLTVFEEDDARTLSADLVMANSLEPMRHLAHFASRGDGVKTFSPDLRMIAEHIFLQRSPHENPLLEVRELSTGKRLFQIHSDSPTEELENGETPFSSWGTFIVALRYEEGVLINLRSGKILKFAQTKSERKFAFEVIFSHDEQLIATNNFLGEINLWSTATGKLVRTFRLTWPSGEERPPDTFAFSPDDRFLVSYYLGPGLCLGDVKTGKIRSWHVPAKDDSAIFSLALTSDNRCLASGDSEGVITLWNTKTRTKLRTLSLPHKGVTALAWSPDNNFLVSGYEDGTLARWRVK